MVTCAINLLVVSQIFASFQFQVNGAEVIFVYSDHYKQGDKEEISISQCSNLSEKMTRQVTSIDTRGKCVRFYDGKNCSGISIEVLPSSPSHDDLNAWDFNDRALSIGPCRHPCDRAITGPVPETVLFAQIFNRQNFKGAYEDIPIGGCTLIPTNLIYRTLSVKTNGQCVQLYSNVNCETRGDNIRSIELRFGTPFHDDISRWWLPEARAMSHCSHKCNSTLSVSQRETVSPGNEEVILFDEKRYQGNWKKLKLESNGCINITKEWEGVVMSIRLGNKTCLRLYDRRDCKGNFYVAASSEEDLSARSFDATTRSVKSCGEWISDKSLQVQSFNQSEQGNTRPNGNVSKPSENNSEYFELSPNILATIIVVPLLGVVISVFLVLFIMKRCHPYKNIMDMLSEKEIQEFLNGLGMEMDNSNGVIGDGDDYSVELAAQNKPYNEAYEITRSRIKYDSKIPLGMGEFGVVFKGTVIVAEEETDNVNTLSVAIKTVKPSAGAHCLRSLLKEVKVMLYVGKHPHIAHLVGCCTENLRKGEILVLMEYCAKGSLETFLQKNRHYFKNIVKKGKIEEQQNQNYSNSNNTSNSNYKNLEDLDSHRVYDFFQLLEWCIEIARGMEFLMLAKVIHSDLAARNVLLTENFQAKISDFGLSKQLYCYSQYVKKHQEPLPWRWLAIESLKHLEFSSKSDVWSYGCLCWEIFTLGEKPYASAVFSSAFISNLEDGLRLPKPKYATTECYNLMIRCWEEDPTQRPTFTEVLDELQEITAIGNNPNAEEVTAKHDSVHNLLYVTTKSEYA